MLFRRVSRIAFRLLLPLLACAIGAGPIVDQLTISGSSIAGGPAVSAPSESAYAIEITGSEDHWQLRYPGMEQPLDWSGTTLERLELHVPQFRVVTLILKSTDYVYTLELPDWHLRELAVPQREFQMRFRTGTAGVFDLVGDHLCGAEVADLQGTLVVQPESLLRQWLRKHSTPTKQAP